MNCPDCQQPLPENYSATHCPHCGKGLPSPGPPPPGAVRWNDWSVFFTVLFAPGVLSLFAALIGSALMFYSTVYGSALAGIFCGVILATRFGRTNAGKVVLIVVTAPLLAAFSVALGYAGCVIALMTKSQ